jgi:hypothetical protein
VFEFTRKAPGVMTMQHEGTNGWAEWKNYVLENQKDMNNKLDEVLKTVNRLELEITAIKIKSGLLSTVGGLVGGVLTVIGKSLLGGGK